MPSQVKRDQRRLLGGLQHCNFKLSVAVSLTRGALLGAITFAPLILPAEALATHNSPPLTATEPAAGSLNSVGASTPNEPQIATAPRVRLANFGQEVSSPESQKLADWVVDSADNGKLPFIIVDKVQARVFVFDAQGQIRGAAPALLGLAIGDDSVPGIGQRKLSSIRPAERTTAAGRFVASLDRDISGQEILWVDYDSALSLHRVVTAQPKERRAERLATPSPLDNRVSYGCINVPVKFYDKVVSPSFTGTYGIVYILPETRSAREVFGSYDVHDSSRQQAAARVAPAGGLTAR
jgi:hypothetical protein